MEYPTRIFYREGAKGSLRTVDAKVVDDGTNKVYHTEDENVVALRDNEDRTSVLREGGDVEETRVDLIREKACQDELYLWGGPVYATEAKIRFLGKHEGKGSLPQYESSTKVRVNDCVLFAEGGMNRDWSWEVKDAGGSSLITQDDEISSLIGHSCMVVGFDEDIDKIQLCQDLV